MKDIEQLKFELSEKQKQLLNLPVNTFVYNPEIEKLTKEITEIEYEIKKLQEE